MPREKKYTKTIAFRVTAQEYALIQRVIDVGAPIGEFPSAVPHKPTDVIRAWINPKLQYQRQAVIEAAKREEARAKRAAKKAAANDNA